MMVLFAHEKKTGKITPVDSKAVSEYRNGGIREKLKVEVRGGDGGRVRIIF